MNWISVEDRLPEEEQEVYIIGHTRYDNKTWEHGVGKYKKRFGWITVSVNLIENTIKPTHWMPLQNPPEL